MAATSAAWVDSLCVTARATVSSRPWMLRTQRALPYR